MNHWRNLLSHDVQAFNQEIAAIPLEDRNMFRSADLSNLDLVTADMKGCDLTDANLTGSKVSGYMLSTCRLERTVLKDIVLDKAWWAEVISTIQKIWEGTDHWNASKIPDFPIVLSGANFSDAQFAGIDFSDVSFTVCSFQRSHFIRALLNNAS
jgi:uncharacterized protein YjbI with pentapeptide repeats